jgi:hypothetical protein
MGKFIAATLPQRNWGFTLNNDATMENRDPPRSLNSVTAARQDNCSTTANYKAQIR